MKAFLFAIIALSCSCVGEVSAPQAPDGIVDRSYEGYLYFHKPDDNNQGVGVKCPASDGVSGVAVDFTSTGATVMSCNKFVDIVFVLDTLELIDANGEQGLTTYTYDAFEGTTIVGAYVKTK